MNITKRQKQTILPLALLIVSFIGLCLTLSAKQPWAILFAPLIGFSFGVFGYYNCEDICKKAGEWFHRDGWK